MAKKNLDLSQYNAGNDKPVRPKKKYEAFRQQENVEEVVAETKTTLEETKVESTSSAGEADRKKNKSMTMAFSDTVYNFIIEQTEMLNVNRQAYIFTIISQSSNEAVDAYINSLPIKITKAYVSKNKGRKAKRMLLRFPAEVYEILQAGAERNDQNITQYANMIMLCYMKTVR